MYTSRDYSSYRKYIHALHEYDNPPLEVLKQRRADKIKTFRKVSWLQRLIIKAHYKLIRENLSEQGLITKEGYVIL